MDQLLLDIKSMLTVLLASVLMFGVIIAMLLDGIREELKRLAVRKDKN